MSEVGVLFTRKFRGRVKVCPDMAEGIEKLGDKVIRKRAEDYRGIFSESLVFYGFDGDRSSTISKAFRDYVDAGKPAIYIDLGYWMRRWRNDRYGYHRFSVGNRHPTAYFQKFKHKKDRADAVEVVLQPWRKPGKNIILCGMSDKCARFEGFEFEQWERAAIQKIRAVTDRPIVYRPKPQRRRGLQYPPIEGVQHSCPMKRSLEDDLSDAWAVVSHHSNAGIDAIVLGIPCFSDEGPTTAIGHQELSIYIEDPHIPSDAERRRWVNDIAYCQWNRVEMRSGQVWKHFKDEGLVP